MPPGGQWLSHFNKPRTSDSGARRKTITFGNIALAIAEYSAFSGVCGKPLSQYMCCAATSGNR